MTVLADPADERETILDSQRTAIYLQGLTPASPGIRATFPAPGLASRNVRVPFPAEPCPACGGQQPIARHQRPAMRMDRIALRPDEPHRRLVIRALAAIALIILLAVLVIGLARP